MINLNGIDRYQSTLEVERQRLLKQLKEIEERIELSKQLYRLVQDPATRNIANAAYELGTLMAKSQMDRDKGPG